MNSAYKHLDSKLRIAELTLGQWAAVMIGLGCGIVWGVYISPFGPSLTTVSAAYMAALPAAAALAARLTEFDPWLVVRSAFAWRRLEGRFLPGSGESAKGYVVTEEERSGANGADGELEDLDLAALLWGEH